MTSRVALVTGANRGWAWRCVASSRHAATRSCSDRGTWRRAKRPRARAVGGRARDRPGRSPIPMRPEKAVREAQRRFERIDVLVNNAGVHYDTWQGVCDADWRIVREAFETNLFGAWRMAQAVAPLMKAAKWGRIVNVSSEAGSLASMGAGTPAYATSKAALNALTRILAAELHGTGVLVNSVCPGWVATDMGGSGGRPVEDGAASILWAVTIPDDGPTGGFFRDGKPLRW